MGSYGGHSHRASITTIKTCRKLAARNPRQITTINAISSHQKLPQPSAKPLLHTTLTWTTMVNLPSNHHWNFFPSSWESKMGKGVEEKEIISNKTLPSVQLSSCYLPITNKGMCTTCLLTYIDVGSGEVKNAHNVFLHILCSMSLPVGFYLFKLVRAFTQDTTGESSSPGVS